MQGNTVSWPERAIQALTKGGMFLADVCMAAMITLVSFNCFLRYAIGHPLYWGDEVMIYLMMLMAFLSFGYMLLENKHIRMTALTMHLSVAAQKKLEVITSLLTLLYSGFLIAGGIYITKDSWQLEAISVTTGDPLAPWQAAVTLGLVIFFLAAVLFGIRKLRGLRGGSPGDAQTQEELTIRV